MSIASARPARWQGWFVYSPTARRVSRLVRMLAPVGAAVSLLIAMDALLRDRPVEGILPLVIVAVPVLVLGQLWGIAWTQLRRSPLVGPASHGRRWSHDFGPLSGRVGWGLVGIGLACALLGGTAAHSGMVLGNPTSPIPGCPYRLANHGTFSCVSYAVYEHAGAAVQRFMASVLALFFVAHLGSALSALHVQPRQADARW